MGRHTCDKIQIRSLLQQRFVQRALVAQDKDGLIWQAKVSQRRGRLSWERKGGGKVLPGKKRAGTKQQFNFLEPKRIVTWYSVWLNAHRLKHCKGRCESQNGDHQAGSSCFTDEDTEVDRGNKSLFGVWNDLSEIELPTLLIFLKAQSTTNYIRYHICHAIFTGQNCFTFCNCTEHIWYLASRKKKKKLIWSDWLETQK